MANIFADRVKETTSTTGTGVVTLNGTSNQYQTFAAAIGVGNTCDYCILSGDGSNWETGNGTVGGTSGAYTLSRDTIFASSNNGQLVSLASTSTVFCTVPSHRLSTLNNSLFNVSSGVPALSSFTQINITTSDVVTEYPGQAITIVDTNAAALTLRGLSRPVPATPYRIATMMQCLHTNSNYYSEIEWGWTDGTKFETMSFQTNALYYEAWSSSSSRASDAAMTALNVYPLWWAGIRDDGTNVYWEISNNGVVWRTIKTSAKSAGYLGSAGYTNAFVGFCNDNGQEFDWTLRLYDENGLNRTF